MHPLGLFSDIVSAHSKLMIIKKVKLSCATLLHGTVFQPVIYKLSLAKLLQGF